jgi:hypothetical protein
MYVPVIRKGKYGPAVGILAEQKASVNAVGPSVSTSVGAHAVSPFYPCCTTATTEVRLQIALNDVPYLPLGNGIAVSAIWTECLNVTRLPVCIFFSFFTNNDVMTLPLYRDSWPSVARNLERKPS